MVRLYGPLMSLDASGTIADAVTFSKWKGRNYARQRVIPANPQSGPQTSNRAMLKFLSQEWAALSDVIKATWDIIAKATNISPFNAYVAYSQKRWHHFHGPSQEYPALDAAVTPAAPTTTVTAGVHQLTLSIADGAQLPDWGWMIHRSIVTGFTPGTDNMVHAIPKTASPTVYIDTDLPVVAHFYRVRGFMADGKLGTLEAQTTGTPTT